MKYLLRCISFLAKKGVSALVVIGVCVTVFTSCMNLSNIFILIGDGLEMRAGAILGSNTGSGLKKYFTADFIENDPLLNDSPYADYKISGSSYTHEFSWLWAWPWQTTTTAVVSERVVLEGEKKRDTLTEGEQTALEAIESDKSLSTGEKAIEKKRLLQAPVWNNGKYEITLRKLAGGSWVIARMVRIEDLPEATLRPN